MMLRYLDLEGTTKDIPLDKPVTLGRSRWKGYFIFT